MSATFVQTNVCMPPGGTMIATTFLYTNVVSATFVRTDVVSATFVQMDAVFATFLQTNVLHAPWGGGTMTATTFL